MKEKIKEKVIKLKTKLEEFDDPINMKIYGDGAISFSDKYAEHFIYLYLDVVKKVKKILKQQTAKQFHDKIDSEDFRDELIIKIQQEVTPYLTFADACRIADFTIKQLKELLK